MKLKLPLFIVCGLTLVSCNLRFVSSSGHINIDTEDGLKFETYRKYLGYHDLPSKGESKLLVIPVVFNDCTLSETKLENEHKRLESTFFGQSEDTYWESVSSFYYKSSYGKLNITGKVSPYFYYGKSVYQANKVYIDENVEPTYPILDAAIEWYNANYDDLDDYDSDKDGYIDSVWLVYMEDYNDLYFQKNPSYSNVNNLSDFLWAYTYWFDRASTSKNHILPYSYAWGSYKFSYEGSENLPDAHTFIHETGHLLGLDDYYNYDYNPQVLRGDKSKPIGGLDMMDLNILDHNAYSKYLLNWIEPRIVNEDGIYELSSFQDAGDCLIVPAGDWNGSPLDEYLILELYTPTKLNQLDSENSYTGEYPKGFSQNGVKIIHVDSRLGKFTVSGGQLVYDSYLDSPNDFNSLKRKYYLTIVNSNTPSRSYVSKNKLITLLSATGVNRYYTHRNYSVANNSDLFKDGSKLKTFTFNQYADNDLVIEIDNMSSTSCSVSIKGLGK